MTRFALIIVVSSFIGLASATRLGLFGLIVVSGIYLAVLVATRADLDVGVGGLVASMAVLQMAYVLGGWIRESRPRRIPTVGCVNDEREGDR